MSDEIVVDSIKKMLQLQMPEDEIIASLVDAGVDYDYSQKMVESIKYNKAIPDEKKPTKKQEDQLFDEQISNSKNSEDPSLKEVDKTSLGVWQEGIITIVTQKLETIEEKEREIDETIKTKVNEITSQELLKMKTIIDSQRTLLSSKIDLLTTQKLNEIKKQVDNNLNLLQEINKNTQKKLEEIDVLTKTLNDMKRSLSEQIDSVQNIKESLNATLDNFKRESTRELQEMFDQYKAQVENITNRTNSTLSLASKILESLVNASRSKIDNYCNDKLDLFMKDLQTKLNVDDIKLALDKLNTIKDFDSKIGTIVDNKISIALSNSNNNSVDYEESITDINRRMMELEKFSKNKTNIDQDDINSRLEELELYREQNSNLIAKLLKEKEQHNSPLEKKNQETADLKPKVQKK